MIVTGVFMGSSEDRGMSFHVGTTFQMCQDEGMATRTRRSQRRTEALSRERIIKAAVELLDADGEGGLTFRVLTERLATGPGAIYWHVANKGELLAAATDAVVAAALAVGPAEPPGSPREEIRAVALGLFDAIEEHPWLATQLAIQLSRNPWGTVAPRIFESLGRPVSALGVPEDRWFTAGSVLVHYVLGAAGQNAANTANVRDLAPGVDRAEFLDAASKAWEKLDPDDYPFTRALAGQVRDHDDREQFLGGVDLVLAGITAGSGEG
jgi:AcrR family transcriptional regulator